MDPGHFGVPLFAKVDGSVKQVLLRRGCPEIQLVPLRPAEETAVVVFREIGRERAASPVATMMNRTISVELMSASAGRDESQEFEDLLHGDHRPHCLKMHTRHRIGPETRRGNPYFSVSIVRRFHKCIL